MKLDVQTIRDALVPSAILDHFEIEYREGGDELYTRACPACGERSRDSMGVHATSGLWKCQRCSAHGDILALVAGYAQIDIKKDFRRVLEIAATIAGIGGGELTPEDRVRIEERRKQGAARLEHQKQQSAIARAQMPGKWEALTKGESYLRDRSLAIKTVQACMRGERYLSDRGLDPKRLREVVRYTRDGDPALPLRDLDTGEIVGVQQRCIDPTKPKLLCFRGSQLAGSALHGRILDLDPEGVDVAVVVEGLADTLAANLAFEGCAIFGAPGAAQVPEVVAAVARRVALCRGWLLVVVDDDDVGVKGAVRGVLAAEEAGLRLDDTIRLVRLGKSLAGKHRHDLADAWRGGWRWEWAAA